MARGHTKTGHNALAAAERQRQALELRKAGVGFQAIADRLGYKDHSGAYRAVKTALKKTLQEPADEVRRVEVERLDAMLLGLWSSAKAGNLLAVDRVLRIMQRRADLLGLDAPQKREITGDLILRQLSERAAADAGLDPAVVLAEAERILAGEAS